MFLLCAVSLLNYTSVITQTICPERKLTQTELLLFSHKHVLCDCSVVEYMLTCVWTGPGVCIVPVLTTTCLYDLRAELLKTWAHICHKWRKREGWQWNQRQRRAGQRSCHTFKSEEIKSRGDCRSSNHFLFLYIYLRQVKGVILKMCWAIEFIHQCAAAARWDR